MSDPCLLCFLVHPQPPHTHRVLVQSVAQNKVTRAQGVEICSVKVKKADDFIRHCSQHMRSLKGLSNRFQLIHGSASQVGALVASPEFFFLFWEGFSMPEKLDIADLIMSTPTRRVGCYGPTSSDDMIHDSLH